MTVKKRRRAATSPIERANQKPDAEFLAAYLSPGAPGATPWTAAWTHPQTKTAYDLLLVRSTAAGEEALEACFGLVEQTSAADYAAAQHGWHPADKRREMREPDLRYILVRQRRLDDHGRQPVRAFASLMPTVEEGQPVVYCYEIHLQPELRGSGLAAILLGFLYTVAYNLPPIAKVMLTCFCSNKRALAFYRKQGFATDPIAPEPRTLRGKTLLPDYTILSKPVER